MATRSSGQRRAEKGKKRALRKAKDQKATDTFGMQIMSMARKWLDSHPDALDEALLDAKEFDSALIRKSDELQSLLGDDIGGFRADLRSAAMFYSVGLADEQGKPQVAARCKLFAIPVHGHQETVENLVADTSKLDAIAGSFREAGLASPQAAIYMIPALFFPEKLAHTLPGLIHRATAALADSIIDGMAGQEPEVETKAHSLIDAFDGYFPEQGRSQEGASALTFVDRILLGVRVYLQPFSDKDEDHWDFFTSFMPVKYLLEAQNDPDDDIQEEMDVAAEILAWDELIQPILGSDSPVSMTLPYDWDRAVAMSAVNRIMTLAQVEMSIHGLSLDRKADRVHFAIDPDGDKAAIVLEFAEKNIGPIDVPVSMIACDMAMSSEAIMSLGSEFIEHDSRDDLPSDADSRPGQ